MKRKDILSISLFLFLVISCVSCSTKSAKYQEDNIDWVKFKHFSKLSNKQQAAVIVVTRGILKKIKKEIDHLEKQGIEFKSANLRVAGGGTEEGGDLFVVATIEFKESEEKTIVLYDGWTLCPEPDSPEVKEIIDDFVEEIISKIIISGQIYL